VYRRRILELSLNRVMIEVTGGRKLRSSRHMVTVCLVWPRPAIAERAAVKTLDFENRTADLSSADWTDRILFKETVQGPFGVEFGITEHLSDERIGKFLKLVGSSLLGLAGGEAEDLMPGPVGAGLVRLPFQHLGKVVSASGTGSARFIGVGAVDLDTDKTWEGGREVRIEIPLVAPEAVYETKRARKHGELSTRRRTVLKAGKSNGMAVLSARLYE